MNRNSIIILGIFVFGAILATGIWYFFVRDVVSNVRFEPPTVERGDGEDEVTSNSSNKNDSSPVSQITLDDPEAWQSDLSVPWGIAQLPNGEWLLTERSGTLLLIDENGSKTPITLPDQATQVGESGLLGLALHPNFSENRWVYLYLTQAIPDGLINKVMRYRFENNQLNEQLALLSSLPGAQYHDGGRISFGPDGYLYITTGDATKPELAQDTNSLAGKILRVTENGSIPKDNPFGNAVYSYGHRNPQGLAWDNEGNLWSTEHGRSGVLSGFDELNRIERGKNYGWPEIQGDETREGMTAPVIHSGPDTTWAPGGLTFVDGYLFWGGLRGQSLYQARVRDSNAELVEQHWVGEYGRLRTTVYDAKNEALLILTSNDDGRNPEGNRPDVVLRTSLTSSQL